MKGGDAIDRATPAEYMQVSNQMQTPLCITEASYVCVLLAFQAVSTAFVLAAGMHDSA
jgi:hypothetical protein